MNEEEFITVMTEQGASESDARDAISFVHESNPFAFSLSLETFATLYKLMSTGEREDLMVLVRSKNGA